jgi:hypothetical protein
MTLDFIPEEIHNLYEVHEWRHACAVLKSDFPDEWKDIMDVLLPFRLKRSQVLAGGGNKSGIAKSLDSGFYRRGWIEKAFDTKFLVDDKEIVSPTHNVDCFKNGVGVEVEWNNKDTFFDRDLNNFRLLFELRTVNVGVIITRCDELQQIFNALKIGGSYGSNTTHLGKLLTKIEGGGGGGCPILAFGITKKLYVEDDEDEQ